MKHLEQISNAAQQIEEALEDVTHEMESKTEASSKLSDEITSKIGSGKKLDEQNRLAIEKYRTADKEFVKVTAEREKILADLDAKIEAASTQLDQTTKQHIQFMEYKARAEKTLEAREESLLLREEELESAIIQAGRRKSILKDLK